MLRFAIAISMAVVLGSAPPLRAQQMSLHDVPCGAPVDSEESWPGEWPTVPDAASNPACGDPVGQYELAVEPIEDDASFSMFHSHWPSPRWFGLRHSDTHGRNVGRGIPLVGTSWLNRPYYIGGELGTLWLTRSIYEDVSRDVDMFGGFFAGYDFDHYWGGELRFDWATPELINGAVPNVSRTDSLFMWSYSFMYYPWGDSLIRPYWRGGIGDVRFDFPREDGVRQDEWMLAFPLGIGVKYPIRRWLAARAEITDHLTIGDDRFPTQNNISLTFGLEWRFGAHPRSYWPWNPDRHIW